MTSITKRKEISPTPFIENLENTKKERILIKAALESGFSGIPDVFLLKYLDFHKEIHTKFLFQVNLLALLAFWFSA